MSGLTLVFNAGSSSLKFALFDAKLTGLMRGQVDWGGDPRVATLTVESKKSELGAVDYAQAVEKIWTVVKAATPNQRIERVGQRVVHGGTRFRQPTRIGPDVLRELEKLSEIAPLHNPPALETIHGVERVMPNVPQTAVFDTAYYQSLEPAQYVYPLPYAWFEEWGIRRFGFHGISHFYCAQRAAEMLNSRTLRLISCHLGQGASVTASQGTQAIATSMGFTPLEGLMMGSRSGSIDPGILSFVERQHSVSAEECEKVLNRESGLKGISGISGDIREVSEAAKGGHSRATLALEMFVQRVRSTIGAMAATLGGMDALVFTAGIGEHDFVIRRRICEPLAFLGVQLDANVNRAAQPDLEITLPTSQVRVLVIHTEEERAIASMIQ